MGSKDAGDDNCKDLAVLWCTCSRTGGHGLGTLRHSVLGQLAGEHQAHGRPDRGRVRSGRRQTLQRWARIVGQRVHDEHGAQEIVAGCTCLSTLMMYEPTASCGPGGIVFLVQSRWNETKMQHMRLGSEPKCDMSPSECPAHRLLPTAAIVSRSGLFFGQNGCLLANFAVK